MAVVVQESNHPLSSPGEEVPLHKQDILHNLVKVCEENISEKEREQLFRLLLKYADVCADRDDELGRSSAVQHSINTGDHHTIKQPCKQIPLARQEHAHKLVEEKLFNHQIVCGHHPWFWLRRRMACTISVWIIGSSVL